MLGKPVYTLNGLKHVNIQLNFLLQQLVTKQAGILGHPWVSFSSDPSVKENFAPVDECLEDKVSGSSFEYSSRKILLSVNFC